MAPRSKSGEIVCMEYRRMGRRMDRRMVGRIDEMDREGTGSV